MGGLAEKWEGWEVQILLLPSLLLQVLLLVFSELRRRASRWALLSAALNGILWLLYQLADSVAIYVLGHMSLSSKPCEQQQLTAFWASLLLVHLGGQDTITAYAMEDNDLWLRHLLTLIVQAAGAAYVLYKYVTGGALLAASVLMFLVGVVKSSGLGSIRKFLDGFEVLNPDKEYQIPVRSDDPEEILQGAHDLLHVCMGQFVDYTVWPSQFQIDAILVYHDRINPDGTTATDGRSMLTQLVGMQLSLMRDILYTKAMVLGAWYGCTSRVVSIVAIGVAFHLFRTSTTGYSRRDMVVTYILLSGAFLLEAVSLLRAAMSTWTCAWLQASGWNRLHAAVACLRKSVKAAQRCRKWSGSIGQHDIFQLRDYDEKSACYLWMFLCFGLEQWWTGLRFLDSVVISHEVEELVVGEIQLMVEAYAINDHISRGPGQLALAHGDMPVQALDYTTAWLEWRRLVSTAAYSPGTTPPVPFSKLTIYMMGVTQVTSPAMVQGLIEMRRQEGLAKAIVTLSRYMMFLFMERPHLLPSPVRRSQYDNFCAKFLMPMNARRAGYASDHIHPEERLVSNMLKMCEDEGIEEVLRVSSQVWVEMLCYAASHCSNDSHARQLSSSTEFITLTWILMTALYNRFQHEDPRFKMIVCHFLERQERRRESNKMMRSAKSSMIWGAVSGAPASVVVAAMEMARNMVTIRSPRMIISQRDRRLQAAADDNRPTFTRSNTI